MQELRIMVSLNLPYSSIATNMRICQFDDVQLMVGVIRITPIALVLSKDIFMERQPRKRWCVHLGTDYLGLYWQTQQIAGLCNSTLNP